MKRTAEAPSVMLPAGVTAEQFVETWQRSNNTREVAKALGMTPLDCTSLAAYLRKRDVPLKHMRPHQVFNIKKLQDIAQEWAPKEGS
jgi:hypothetical protein